MDLAVPTPRSMIASEHPSLCLTEPSTQSTHTQAARHHRSTQGCGARLRSTQVQSTPTKNAMCKERHIHMCLCMQLWRALFLSLIRSLLAPPWDASFETVSDAGDGGSKRPEGASRSKDDDSAFLGSHESRRWHSHRGFHGHQNWRSEKE